MHRSRLACHRDVALVLAACAEHPDKETLASLREVQADTAEVQVTDGLDKAMESYRRFLDETPESTLTPGSDATPRGSQDREGVRPSGRWQARGGRWRRPRRKAIAASRRSAPGACRLRPLRRRSTRQRQQGRDRHRERRRLHCRFRARARAARQQPVARSCRPTNCPSWRCPRALIAVSNVPARLEAIRLYDELLAKYPSYAYRDQVLYQKARAYDELGRTADSMKVMEQLIAEHPRSRYLDEVQFRRAEHFFTQQEVSRRRERLRGHRRPSGRARSTTSSRSTSSAGRSTSRSSTRRRCTAISRCSTTRSRAATTSMRRTTRRKSDASRTRSRS